MAGVVVFDINETTLDLEPVRTVIDDLVGPEGGFTAWFPRLLQLSMTTTAIGHYVDFTTLARQALDAVAATGESEPGDDGWSQVTAAMGRLQAHPDVADGLTSLRESGWTTVALTNSAQATVEAQLDGAGLAPLFDHTLSVDAVRQYKPSRGPYHYAAAVVGTDPAEMWMVACHDWDLAGARSAGFSTAFVRRPAMSYAATFAAPDLEVDDFVELADRLID